MLVFLLIFSVNAVLAQVEITTNINDRVTLDASKVSFEVGNISMYVWSFGDNTFESSNDSSIQHTFGSAGTYNITLTVLDSNNIPDERIFTLLCKVNRPPIAKFQILYSSNGLIFLLSNTSDSFDLDGYITTYTWDFNDGTIITLDNHDLQNFSLVKHTYFEEGLYKITLSVTDNSNVTTSVTLEYLVEIGNSSFLKTSSLMSFGCKTLTSFNIYHKLPTPVIFFWTDFDNELLTHFDIRGSSPFYTNESISYLWDFGDGNFAQSNESLISYTFSISGTYNVSLLTINSFGISSESHVIVSIGLSDNFQDLKNIDEEKLFIPMFVNLMNKNSGLYLKYNTLNLTLNNEEDRFLFSLHSTNKPKIYYIKAASIGLYLTGFDIYLGLNSEGSQFYISQVGSYFQIIDNISGLKLGINNQSSLILTTETSESSTWLIIPHHDFDFVV